MTTKRVPALRASEYNEMVRLRRQGLTYRAIGLKVGLTERMVQRILTIPGYGATLRYVTLVQMRRLRAELDRVARRRRRARAPRSVEAPVAPVAPVEQSV